MPIEIKTEATLILSKEQKTGLKDTLKLIEELWYDVDDETDKIIKSECESKIPFVNRGCFNIHSTMITLRALALLAKI